jgi:SEC-C motif
MSKIGRNDPCPCGSGIKYKRCCISKANSGRDQGPGSGPGAGSGPRPRPNAARPETLFESIVRTNEAMEAIMTLAALQLDPANHGRNFRIEQLMRTALRWMRRGDTRPSPPPAVIKAAIESYTDGAGMEDPLSNFFTEVVAFETGNNIVFAGIFAEYGRILSTFSDAIFRQRHSLPPAFVADVRNAMGVLLLLSDTAARVAGLSPLIPGPEDSENIVVPAEEDLARYRNALLFPKDSLSKYCERRKFDPKVLSEFTVHPDDPAFSDGDPENNVVNIKPIIDLGDAVLLYMPTGVPSALVEYIYRITEKYNCTAELRDTFNKRKIYLCQRALEHLGWRLTNIEFPATELPIEEVAYQIDNQKVAHVCFIKTGEKYPEAPLGKGGHDLLMEHVNQTVAQLSSLDPKQPFQVFNLFILIESGNDYFFSWPKPAPGNQTLSFKDEELLSAAYADHVDVLTFWKFAKCHSRTNEIARVESMGGMLDAFAVYRAGHGSLLHSDAGRPIGGMLCIFPGEGDELRRKVASERNEHAVAILAGDRIGFATVYRLKSYAPIYVETDVSKHFRIVIESYPMPIWIINDQTPVFSENFATQACEAIAFWLLRVTNDLEPHFGITKLPPLVFEVEVANALLHDDESMVPDTLSGDPRPTATITETGMKVNIPAAFFKVITRPDNTADKLLLSATLAGLGDYLNKKGIEHTLTAEVIDIIVTTTLANPQAKMLLFSDATQNVKRDRRRLPPRRYVQSSDISYILDNLTSTLPPDTTVPKKIVKKEDKTSLCTKIVQSLLGQLESKMAAFGGEGLLRWLIQLHERYIFEREYREILVPARIACFSDVEKELSYRLDGERDLASTGHTLRTLIEFVASKPPTGSRWPNFDDVDELVALTNQVTEWGALEESIRFGLDDPEMGLLPSGRIGTSKSFERQNLREYAKAHVEGDVFRDMEDFEKNYYRASDGKAPTPDPHTEQLNQAFLAENGCTFDELGRFAGALIGVKFAEGASVVSLSEGEIIKLAKETAGLPEDRARAALALWTLVPRDSLGKPPSGYSMKDIMTWHFNRDLSTIRRPLVRVQSQDGPIYLFGYRHISFVFDHLQYLLFTSKYPEPKSPELQSWLAGVSGRKGNPFRQKVYQWFKENTDLVAISHEINMKPGAGAGHFRTDTDLGDIDLAVIDVNNKIFYSLECKNVGGARNIHEMKVELDNYLGKKPNDPAAKVNKHLRRHDWLLANKKSLGQFVADPEKYEIKSIILTADELSLAYLGKKELPLPIRSFVFLRMHGVSYLGGVPTK